MIHVTELVFLSVGYIIDGLYRESQRCVFRMHAQIYMCQLYHSHKRFINDAIEMGATPTFSNIFAVHNCTHVSECSVM